MSKNLVIVESPSKSKTIEKYLGSDYKVLSNVKTQLKEVNLSKEKLIQVRKLIRDVSDEREATSIQLYKIRDKFIIVFKLDGIEMPSLIIASELNDKQLFLEYYEN